MMILYFENMKKIKGEKSKLFILEDQNSDFKFRG